MVTWTKLICNGYEPDNRLHLHGDIEHKDGEYLLHIRRVSFAGFFRDGFMNCGLDLVSGQGDDGEWRWHVGAKEGTCNSYSESWANLPGYITHPDHWEWVNQPTGEE